MIIKIKLSDGVEALAMCYLGEQAVNYDLQTRKVNTSNSITEVIHP